MTPRIFAGLSLAAGASAVLAGLLYASQNRWSPGRIDGEPAIGSLMARANDAGAVQIVQGERTLTLERKGEAWSLKERDGYPANAEKARALVVQLAKAQLIEVKTRTPEKHALLELEDPKGKTAKSRLVRVLDASGKPLGELITGKQRSDALGSGRSATYVRRPAEAQTWLADVGIEAPLEARDWIDRNVFQLDNSKVRELNMSLFGEPTLTVKRKAPKEGEAKDAAKDQGFELGPIPEGKKLKNDGAGDTLARSYSTIDMEDVRKAAPPAADAKESKAVLHSTDGLTVTFTMVKEGDASWLSVAAAGEGAAKEQADKINARTAGWQFKLAPVTAGQLFKPAAELFDAASG